MSWENCLKDIEDHLCPELKLTVWEKGLYYYLLRNTQLVGKEEGLFSIQALAVALNISEDKIRKSLRSMDSKGCIRIMERSGRGRLIRVLLPSEIDNSYSNIVACCHECNSGKQGRSGYDFVRALYRRGLLTTPEFDERIVKLELLRSGNLIPRLRHH